MGLKTLTFDDRRYKLVPAEPTQEQKIAGNHAGWWCGDMYRAMIATAPDHPATDMAAAIHYPDCWDTAAYPTLESALRELAHGFRCTSDECTHPATAGDAEYTEIETLLDAADEWANYVEVDTAPMTLRKYLERALRASKGGE